MSRFQFIADEYPEIFELCSEVEKNKKANANLSILKARQALEKILAVTNLCAQYDDLFDQINSLYGECSLAEMETMHILRRLGNMAIRRKNLSEQNVDKALRALLLSCCWLYFKLDENVCPLSLFWQDDRDIAEPYVNEALRGNGGIRDSLKKTYHSTNPLSFDNTFDEVEDTALNIWDKDVFETEAEYEERIRQLSPIHLGFGMIDDKQIDSYTHLAFPRFCLAKNEKIVGADINAFIVKVEQENDWAYDGEILVALKVCQGKIYYDYSKVVLRFGTDELPLTVLYWNQFAYENYIDFEQRMNQLPILPIGVCKPIKQKYDIDKQLLPFQISCYDFVQDVFSDIKINISVNRCQAKKVCQASGIWKIYGKMVRGEIDYFIEAKVISRCGRQSQVKKDTDTITIKCNVNRKQSAREQYKIGKKFYNRGNYAEAVKWYRKAANKGDNKARNDLGNCYYGGKGVEKDELEAVRWFWDAAVQGDAEAQNSLGDCYYYGKGVEVNETEAAEWYQGAADKGHAGAQTKIGNCYYYGNGVKKDYAKATEWYQKAAIQGNIKAQKKLGDCYYSGRGIVQNYEKAAKWYQKVAEQGYADAQTKIGNCYYSGKGVKQDYEKAAKWYQKAGIQGSIKAQDRLGDCYYWGRGVKQDYEEAVKWYQKAGAYNKLGKCCYKLGDCYYSGRGIEQNYERAAKWYQKAAYCGYADAHRKFCKFCCELGDCYYYGSNIVEKDESKAIMWYQKAAERGYAEAQNKLGDCYYQGNGVEQNYMEAVKWYKKAAEQGYAPSKTHLGDCYYWGKGIEKNETKAMKWYKKAANQGYACAQSILGDCYYWGNGVKRNYEKAAKWYQKAADQGDKYAQERLQRIEKPSE
ncbi:tetratricopeptide repeat protein [Megasphaera elsdenii]|uniref:tetratricopeptide repeat protein n=1 Tax=Megasphaera elsdenii TaxID=907 RepID=UPI0024310D79|nr:tetratricopeptide repeat protein [Megasphaera elsdenii]